FAAVPARATRPPRSAGPSAQQGRSAPLLPRRQEPPLGVRLPGRRELAEPVLPPGQEHCSPSSGAARTSGKKRFSYDLPFGTRRVTVAGTDYNRKQDDVCLRRGGERFAG